MRISSTLNIVLCTIPVNLSLFLCVLHIWYDILDVWNLGAESTFGEGIRGSLDTFVICIGLDGCSMWIQFWLEVPSRRCPGLRIFSSVEILSNCTHRDKTKNQTLLVSRRIQNGIIHWCWRPWSHKHFSQRRDLISSRDRDILKFHSPTKPFIVKMPWHFS